MSHRLCTGFVTEPLDEKPDLGLKLKRQLVHPQQVCTKEVCSGKQRASKRRAPWAEGHEIHKGRHEDELGGDLQSHACL